MAKNQSAFNNIKKAAKEIQKNLEDTNKKLTDLSENVIKETVKTGEAWQELLQKAIKESKPLLKKQSEILSETAKDMRSEAAYSIERFEKLTGYDFSAIRNSFEAETKRFKEGFEYITDQTEEILSEVSKRGDEIAETVADTAKSFVKEAEEMKDKAETKIKEVIKEVENRISDIAPQASASNRKSAPKKTAKRKTTAKKKSTAKASKTAKTTTAKKAAPKKTAPKKVVAKKAPTSKKTAAKVVRIKADDLKVIEGVGPKLESILKAAGYKNHTDLAAAKVADLRKVLAEAGSRYQMHNPTSWAKQAQMASKGEFDKLKKWQAENNSKKS